MSGWSEAKDLFTLDGTAKSCCTPESRIRGTARRSIETGATARSKRDAEGQPVDPAAKALGVALIDYDNDGWIDLFVANDTAEPALS
jgi:hypothetical protein